jgi:hypothetical protein
MSITFIRTTILAEGIVQRFNTSSYEKILPDSLKLHFKLLMQK